MMNFLFTYFLSSPKDILTDYTERGREKEREGEKQQCERDTGHLPPTPALTGIRPTMQAVP